MHSLVAERRHSSVTRYAKRSVACRDSPRQQPLRAGGTPLPRHPSYCASTSSAIHRFAPSSQYIAIGEKTAEERFNMLARGWLAYPVTSMHAHLPPKSGCINVIPAYARGALLLVTPSARRDSGGRMGHRRAPSLCASEMRYFPLSMRHTTIGENRRRAVLYVSTGLACLPRDADARTSTAEERLYKRHPGMRQRRITPRNPIRTTWLGHHLYALRRCATSPPSARRIPIEKNRHPSACLPRGCRKKDRWLGFQPSVSVSLRSAVRLLVDNTTLFDTSLLACKVAQIVQFCTTHFTKLVDCDAVDKR